MNTVTDEHILCEKGENYWHFREDPKSWMGSYSITVIHDGTVVLTGDYGSLALRWKCFPEKLSDIPLIITDGIHINYFAEKVVTHNTPPKIRSWDEDRARKEVKEDLTEYKTVEDVDAFMENLYFDTQEEMYNELYQKLPQEDWSEGNYGEDYTSAFKWQMELFKRWARAVRTKEKPLKVVE